MRKLELVSEVAELEIAELRHVTETTYVTKPPDYLSIFNIHYYMPVS